MLRPSCPPGWFGAGMSASLRTRVIAYSSYALWHGSSWCCGRRAVPLGAMRWWSSL
jgi:hypothetical protein